MFQASHPFLFFDYFRIPYGHADDAPVPFDGLAALRPTRDAPDAIYWPADPSECDPLAISRIRGIPLVARLIPDTAARSRLEPLGRGWRPETPIENDRGEHIASIWRSDTSETFIPFDPGEAIESLLSERYKTVGTASGARGALKSAALSTYYAVRPALPRSAQIGLRRAFSHVQGRTRFPAWPVETGLHDLYDLLFRLAPWPNGKRWAIVLTHDVETDVGYENISLLRAIEEQNGFSSSWNFVPKRYAVDDDVVAELTGSGFEVGVHGLYHDGRDLESRRTLTERLPEIQEWGRRWQARGFRSPATHRDWELMPLLPFDYDSSYPDTDPYEPTPGGCLSWLPFFNGELVELPITLPQDHTLFVILRHEDEDAWVEKTAAIREAGGMALLITHPDYMLDPKLLGVYGRFLRRFADDPTAWRALPKDVSAWWRRRAASWVERSDNGWLVVGPAAAEAVVQLTVVSDHS